MHDNVFWLMRYVNQYIVINMNLFVPKQPLQKGLLYVIEEVPGYSQGQDLTHILALGYWPSYNVPYFPFIYDISGYGGMYNLTSDFSYTYELAARAKIFRRMQSQISSLEDMKTMLR